MVVTDLDGTLIDSDRILSGVLRTVLKSHGFDEKKVGQAFECLHHGSLDGEPRKMFNVSSGEQGVLEKALQSEIEKVKFTLFPGAASALGDIGEMGCKLSIATNNYERNVLRILDYTGIRRFFDESLVFTFDNFKFKKPSPEIMGEIYRRAGRKRGVIVGNASRDLQFAVNCRLPAIIMNPDGQDVSDKLINAKTNGINTVMTTRWGDVPKIIQELVA